LKTADVVVGTPGRILDHLERRTINFKKIEILVLDEADRMLDMGFLEDVEKIIQECHSRKQTLLFSATISSDVVHLAHKYMKNPVEVSGEPCVDPKKLTQFYYDVPDTLKFSLLVHLLKNEESNLTMVFCNTRRNVDFVANNLKFSGINALPIHGGFSQEKRNNAIKQFHAEKAYVLVCTDVAARGLDIKNVSHVYNYDIPKDSKDYIHRIGRTARAGKEGKVINILTGRDYENFRRILRENALDLISEEKLPDEMERISIQWKGRSEEFNGRRRNTEGTYRSHSERETRGRSRNRENSEEKYRKTTPRSRNR